MFWLTPDNTRGAGAPSAKSIETDPLTANTYAYVNGDPINLMDPTGHACSDDSAKTWRECKNTRTYCLDAYGCTTDSGKTFVSRERYRADRAISLGDAPPTVPGVDPRVDNYFNSAYRPGLEIPGGPASALRYEIENEVRFKSPSGHYLKVESEINRLECILREEELNPINRTAVEAELGALRSAKTFADVEAAARGTNAADLLKTYRRIEELPKDVQPGPPEPSPPASGPEVPFGGGFNPLFLIPIPSQLFGCETVAYEHCTESA